MSVFWMVVEILYIYQKHYYKVSDKMSMNK